jgi:hypothetical protein
MHQHSYPHSITVATASTCKRAIWNPRNQTLCTHQSPGSTVGRSQSKVCRNRHTMIAVDVNLHLPEYLPEELRRDINPNHCLTGH